MTASPYLVACLVQLRYEFNAVSPKRDTGADGWIGDSAHRTEVSDHNPDASGRVLAVDIDASGPWPYPFDTYVELIVARQRSGADDRLEYVIWNRRIASRDSRWVWQKYTGTSDPHTGHMHASARHDHTGNTSGRTWALNTIGDERVTPDDISKVASAVWAAGFGGADDRETAGQRLGNIDARIDAIDDKLDQLLAAVTPAPQDRA